MNHTRFEDFQGRGGLPNTRICLGDKKISLHSMDPLVEAERIIKHFSPQTEWVVVAGLGLGYVVQAILDTTRYHILLFEADDLILEHARELVDIDSILKHPRVTRVSSQDQLMTSLAENRVREISYYIHRPYLQLFPETYQNLEGILVAYLTRRQINQATLQRFQYTWLRNLIKNSAFFFKYPGFTELRHPFSGHPAVIVGAGPSLSEQLPSLKELQDYTCIIATDTAYPVLCSQNIRCDFVVSVDPQNKNTLFLQYADCRNGCLVLDAAGSFLSFAKSGFSEIVYYDSFFPVYQELCQYWGSKNSLQSGGSVSTNAFDLARQLGCAPVILLGQDLSFPGCQTHHERNILEEFLYYHTSRLDTYENYNSRSLLLADHIQVDSNSGGKVATDRRFLTYLDWFVREIRQNQVRVINTSLMGARISGTEVMNLKEALRGSIPLKDTRISFTKEYSHSEREYLELLDSIQLEIRQIIPYCREALQAARSCNAAGKDKQQKLFQTMNRFDSILLGSMKKGKATARFMELSMQSAIEQIVSLGDSREVTSELIQGWISLYQEAWRSLFLIDRLITKRKKIATAVQ